MRLWEHVKENDFAYTLAAILLIALVAGSIQGSAEEKELDFAAKEMAKKWGVTERTARVLIKSSRPETIRRTYIAR